MKYKFAVSALSLLLLFLFLSCSEAVIPMMTKDESGSATLTNDYAYGTTGSATPPPIINMNASSPVNPLGVSVRSVYQSSNGVRYIDLMGTVSAFWNGSPNGIPDGLHSIIPTGSSSTPEATDYPITVPTATAGYPLYQTDPGLQPVDIPLEDNIRLRTISEKQNSKYTALAISGLVDSRSLVVIKEYNESIRLFAESNPGLIDAYNTISIPARRTMTFKRDPNLFRLAGVGEQTTTSYLRGGGTGGFNVLIWDGASPRTAIFDISYDAEKTWKRTIVDWSRVTFENTKLQFMAWYNNEGFSPPATVVISSIVPGTPNADGIITSYEVGITGVSSMNNGASIDNFLIPTFYPANASDKDVYIKPDTGAGKLYTKTWNSVVSTEDTAITVEIADRIKITRKGYTPFSAVNVPFTVLCVTNPPTPASGTAAPVTIELNFKLNS